MSSALGQTGDISFLFLGRKFVIRLDPKVASPNYYTDLLIENLENLNLDGRVVLDAGSGTGIISVLALTVLRAASVWAVDIDPDAVALTKHNCLSNGCDPKRIRFIQADIRELTPPETLDVILANPPQIPTPDIASGPCSGGPSGRDVMEAILRLGSRSLRPGGSLVMTAADFVGEEELIRFSHSLGMSVRTIATRVCEPGPYTLSFRPYIERGGYEFGSRNGKLFFTLNLLAFGVS